jgi:restriction system protein
MAARTVVPPIPMDEWLRQHAGEDVDQMHGVVFEHVLACMFTKLGYTVELTQTYDYGADLIVSQNGNRTAIQAKRHTATVGDSAVQQVVVGRSYYQCTSATIVTTSELTARARKLAASCAVSIIERVNLMRLLQQARMVHSPQLLAAPLCRKCKIALVQRSGKFGPFWGCTNFPRGCASKAQLHYSLVLTAPDHAAPSLHPAPPPVQAPLPPIVMLPPRGRPNGWRKSAG